MATLSESGGPCAEHYGRYLISVLSTFGTGQAKCKACCACLEHMLVR